MVGVIPADAKVPEVVQCFGAETSGSELLTVSVSVVGIRCGCLLSVSRSYRVCIFWLFHRNGIFVIHRHIDVCDIQS